MTNGSAADAEKFVVLAVVVCAASTPFANQSRLVPDRTMAWCCHCPNTAAYHGETVLPAGVTSTEFPEVSSSMESEKPQQTPIEKIRLYACDCALTQHSMVKSAEPSWTADAGTVTTLVAFPANDKLPLAPGGADALLVTPPVAETITPKPLESANGVALLAAVRRSSVPETAGRGRRASGEKATGYTAVPTAMRKLETSPLYARKVRSPPRSMGFANDAEKFEAALISTARKESEQEGHPTSAQHASAHPLLDAHVASHPTRRACRRQTTR